MEDNEYFESNNRFKRKLEMPKIETKPDWKSIAEDLAEACQDLVDKMNRLDSTNDDFEENYKLIESALENYKKLKDGKQTTLRKQKTE